MLRACPAGRSLDGGRRAGETDMTTEIDHTPEAIALARIAGAAREVQAASAALEKHFGANGGAQPSTLELARFAAAMQELRDAREEFDRLMNRQSRETAADKT